MATLENVSVEDLRQILAEVDDADATKRLMAAITYKEIDELTQTEAAELYGFSSSWASKWFNRLERLAEADDEIERSAQAAVDAIAEGRAEAAGTESDRGEAAAFCPQCGAAIETDPAPNFCRNCGHEL